MRPSRWSHLVQASTGVGVQRPFFTLPHSGGRRMVTTVRLTVIPSCSAASLKSLVHCRLTTAGCCCRTQATNEYCCCQTFQNAIKTAQLQGWKGRVRLLSRSPLLITLIMILLLRPMPMERRVHPVNMGLVSNFSGTVTHPHGFSVHYALTFPCDPSDLSENAPQRLRAD